MRTMRGTRKALLGALCGAVMALGAVAAPAQGAAGDPLFVFVPDGKTDVPPTPPVGYLVGPCGLAVNSAGDFYVSDYYHHAVDVFEPRTSPFRPKYLTQLAGEDPLDGPCGLALDSTGHLYVNNFHRNVAKFNPQPSFGAGTVLPLPAEDTAHHLPSGVAVNPTTNNVYLDNRTYITAFDSSGAQLMDGLKPLQIGLGTLQDGYGLALDAAGRLYVPDASDNTVKVYEPATSMTDPVLTITGPPGGFTSLRDAAVAVDQVTGHLYVVDDLQPTYTERPQAQVEVFGPAGSYLGVLKYRIVDALPAGLTVDNASGNQGRVYVTSGNTDQAGVYAYAPGSQTVSSLPPTAGLTLSALGSGQGTITSDLGAIACTGACEAQIRAGAKVTLTASAAQGSAFTGWSGGGCAGTGECTVAMSEARVVKAEFEAVPGPYLPATASSAPSPAAGPPAGAATPNAKRHRRAKRHHHHHRLKRNSTVKKRDR